MVIPSKAGNGSLWKTEGTARVRRSYVSRDIQGIGGFVDL